MPIRRTPRDFFDKRVLQQGNSSTRGFFGKKFLQQGGFFDLTLFFDTVFTPESFSIPRSFRVLLTLASSLVQDTAMWSHSSGQHARAKNNPSLKSFPDSIERERERGKRKTWVTPASAFEKNAWCVSLGLWGGGDWYAPPIQTPTMSPTPTLTSATTRSRTRCYEQENDGHRPTRWMPVGRCPGTIKEKLGSGGNMRKEGRKEAEDIRAEQSRAEQRRRELLSPPPGCVDVPHLPAL